MKNRLVRTLACMLAFALLLMLGAPAHADEEAGAARLADVNGGLCVYIDGSAAQLENVVCSGSFLVHALQRDVKAVSAIRKHIQDNGLTPFVSVEAWPADAEIPYKKNHVSLMVVRAFPALAAHGTTLKALIHMMAPLGKACLGGIAQTDRVRIETELRNAGVASPAWKDGWLVFQKPWLEGMGEWPQPQHGPDGNPVANDTYLGVPNQVQWITGSGGTPLVARGRAIYSGRSSVMARDAGSGVRLWENGRVGDGICFGEDVLAKLNVERGARQEAAVVSGKTGRILRTFPMDGAIRAYADDVAIAEGWSSYRAYEVSTGKALWGIGYKRGGTNAIGTVKWLRGGRGNAPQFALLMSGDRVFVRRESGELMAMESKSGNVVWKRNPREELGTPYAMHFLFDDKILIRSEKVEEVICHVMTGMESKGPLKKVDLSFIALSMKDGSEVWRYTIKTLVKNTYRGQVWKAANRIWIGRHDELLPEDLTASDDAMENGKKFRKYSIEPDPMVFDGVNLQTGYIERTVTVPSQINFHCYQLTVTDRYHTGNRPYYFVNWETGKLEGRFGVVRARCDGIGHRAAQGLFFARGGYGCGCIRTVMAAEGAFSSSDDGSWDGAVPEADHPMEKGTAALPEEAQPAEGDWPMLRGGMMRSGAGKSRIPDRLTQKWHFTPGRNDAWVTSLLRKDYLQSSVLGRKTTSQPVIANGKAFVSQLENKCVTALDLESGTVLWTKQFPARADAPPSISKGLALVGCSDGWVYALRTDTGEQVYRLRIAPAERRVVAYGQLESSWPVVGGVLVVGDMAYAIAGRTTEVDGGLYVVAFDTKSGRLAWQGRRYLNNPGDIGKADHERAMNEGAGAADILSSDGKLIAIGTRTDRQACFDAKTGADGGKYVGRSYTFGRNQGAPIFSVANGMEFSVKAPVLESTEGPIRKPAPGRIFARKANKDTWGFSTDYSNPVAIAAGGDRLAVALSKEGANELWILSCAEGKKLAGYPLPSEPAQDGIAIVKDSVLVTLSDGGVVAFGGK